MEARKVNPLRTVQCRSYVDDVGKRVRRGERETERERERERDIHTDRQTDIHTDRQTGSFSFERELGGAVCVVIVSLFCSHC